VISDFAEFILSRYRVKRRFFMGRRFLLYSPAVSSPFQKKNLSRCDWSLNLEKISKSDLSKRKRSLY
jgi:hypothetical protein